jgi:bleomycin hydrolase
MTHAMVISAVHVDEKTGRPIRFKVENSWGDESGVKGFNVMSEKWFDQFVYQVVVHRSLATKEHVKIFETAEKVVLPAWDPMVGQSFLSDRHKILTVLPGCLGMSARYTSSPLFDVIYATYLFVRSQTEDLLYH